MCRGIIDRFEGDWALVEINGQIKEFSRNAIPAEAREGDTVIICGEIIKIDKAATDELKKRIDTLMSEVWEEE